MDRFDKVGVILSIGCLIHCLMLPFVLAITPAIGLTAIVEVDQIHITLAIAVIIISLVSFFPGLHRKFSTFLLSIVGTALVVSGIHLHNFEIILTASGSSLLTIAHFLNHKYKCDHDHHKEHS